MAERTVLIVEDDDANGELLVDLMEMEGFSPLWSRTYEEAISLLASSEEISLVLADLGSSSYGKGAWAPIVRLRAAADGLPIVVCTGHTQAAAENPLDHQVSDIVIKPFDLDDLLHRVKQAASGPANHNGHNGHSARH